MLSFLMKTILITIIWWKNDTAKQTIGYHH